MSLHPVLNSNLLVCSATQTAAHYHFHKQMNTPDVAGVESQVNQVTRLLTLKSQRKLACIRTYEDDWDGNGSVKPDAEAIANAEARLPELCRLCSLVGVWREPQISASEDGEIIFEWWAKPRKVTLYFGPQSMEVIQSWGTNIESEMLQQPMATLDLFVMTWTWLLYG